jgi:anthranilate/para-aminobenzoate synthase component II
LPLLQYLGDLGADFLVFKNDEKTVDEIRALNPAGILVSPGPGASFRCFLQAAAVSCKQLVMLCWW